MISEASISKMISDLEHELLVTQIRLDTLRNLLASGAESSSGVEDTTYPTVAHVNVDIPVTRSITSSIRDFYRAQTKPFTVDQVRRAVKATSKEGPRIRSVLWMAKKDGELEHVRTGVYRY